MKAEAHIKFAVEIACRLGAVDASKSGHLGEKFDLSPWHFSKIERVSCFYIIVHFSQK